MPQKAQVEMPFKLMTFWKKKQTGLYHCLFIIISL